MHFYILAPATFVSLNRADVKSNRTTSGNYWLCNYYYTPGTTPLNKLLHSFFGSEYRVSEYDCFEAVLVIIVWMLEYALYHAYRMKMLICRYCYLTFQPRKTLAYQSHCVTLSQCRLPCYIILVPRLSVLKYCIGGCVVQHMRIIKFLRRVSYFGWLLYICEKRITPQIIQWISKISDL